MMRFRRSKQAVREIKLMYSLSFRAAGQSASAILSHMTTTLLPYQRGYDPCSRPLVLSSSPTTAEQSVFSLENPIPRARGSVLRLLLPVAHLLHLRFFLAVLPAWAPLIRPYGPFSRPSSVLSSTPPYIHRPVLVPQSIRLEH